MVRDPRRLDQNPVVTDPANVDAVREERLTAVSNPLKPPLDEISNDRDERDGAPDKRSGERFSPKTIQTVDGSVEGTPRKPDDPRR